MLSNEAFLHSLKYNLPAFALLNTYAHTQSLKSCSFNLVYLTNQQLNKEKKAPESSLFLKAEQMTTSKAINKYKSNRAGSRGMFLIWVKMGWLQKGDFPSLNVKQLQFLMDLFSATSPCRAEARRSQRGWRLRLRYFFFLSSPPFSV